MKLLVQFIYTAKIIKPRCRKPIEVAVLDQTEVEIKELTSSDLPIAFRVGSSEIRFDGEHLWDYDFHTVTDEEPRKVTLDEVVRYTNDITGYRWSCSGAQAPFHNFWSRWDEPTVQQNAWLKDGIPRKDDIKHREWVSDNRDEIIKLAQSIAARRCSMDGAMMHITSEPRYNAICFGLGNNHASTALMESGHFNQNLKMESYFRADQLEEAIEYTTKLAENRGDTNSLPIKPHTIIEVLMPEAVRLEIPNDEDSDDE